MTNFYLFMGTFIFGCGVLGFLTRRNLILMFLSLELMLFGVSLNFIVFGNLHHNLGGQIFTLLILTVAACEAALALAMIVKLYRSRGTLDVNIWQSLRETPVSATAEGSVMPDADIQEESSYGELPKLTPAGHDPLKLPMPADALGQAPTGVA